MTLLRVSLMAALADQVSKYLVVRHFQINESIAVIRDFLYITYIQNPGAAFGFMANTRSVFRIPFFVAITVGAGLIVYAYQRFIPYEKKWTRFALGLIWGGAMGNFIDRIFYYKVVDFIDAGHIPFPFSLRFSYVFNVADSCITVGLTILVLTYFFERPDKKREGV